MPPKKGVSLEEKRTRLLEFFTREHMFYSIKEVETSASKATGIHAMQIKEVLQGLVDDGLVNAEKCGISIVYWCFEYDRIKSQKSMLDKNLEKARSTRQSNDEFEKEIAREQDARSRGDGGERFALVESLQKRRDELNSILEDSIFDTDKISSIKSDLFFRASNAEVCVDNIESIIYHFSKKNDIKREFFEQELNIPGEFISLPDIEKVFKELK